jgi:cytochrome b
MTTAAFWGSEAMEEIRSALANAMIGLILLHVFGVLVASCEHRQNLVKAMITGRKRGS